MHVKMWSLFCVDAVCDNTFVLPMYNIMGGSLHENNLNPPVINLTDSSWDVSQLSMR